jgi:hypothetical protein
MLPIHFFAASHHSFEASTPDSELLLSLIPANLPIDGG